MLRRQELRLRRSWRALNPDRGREVVGGKGAAIWEPELCGAARTGDAPALHAALLARTRVRGIALSDVDDGSFAVTIRIQSAVGNYVSVAGAGADVLARAVNPFRSGDGVMDAGVMEFTALPEDAARMLAALEYVHVVDDIYDERGYATDTVTVTATGGACLRSDDLSDDFPDARELTRCPRAADVGATSVHVEVRVSGRVKDLGERSEPAWRRGFSSLLPIAASLAAAAAWSAYTMWSGCAWALERAGAGSIGRDDGREQFSRTARRSAGRHIASAWNK